MNRVVGLVGAGIVGALLAVAYVAGVSQSTSGPEPAVAPLDLPSYCRHVYGGDSIGIESPVPERLQCTSMLNGVWGLQPVDLDAACRWQRGDGSRFVLREVEAGVAEPAIEVRCTA